VGGVLIPYRLHDRPRSEAGTQLTRKNPHCRGAQLVHIYQFPEIQPAEQQHFRHPAKIDAVRIKAA